MRVATGMQGLHYVLHAPQGDTYADLLFTMIERRDRRPPVTYTTFAARDLGGDTAELFKTAAKNAYDRFQPQAMIVGASCTGSLIQDDPGGLARALRSAQISPSSSSALGRDTARLTSGAIFTSNPVSFGVASGLMSAPMAQLRFSRMLRSGRSVTAMVQRGVSFSARVARKIARSASASGEPATGGGGRFHGRRAGKPGHRLHRQADR
eukprot:gene42276-57237_t